MMKGKLRWISRMALVAILIFLMTGSAFGLDQHLGTKYFAEPETAWYFGRIDSPFYAGVYGKGEEVEVVKRGIARDANQNKVYMSCGFDAFGKTVFVKQNSLTKEKPAFSYKVTPYFKCLVLKKGIKLYEEPRSESKATFYSGEELYTVGKATGEAAGWYKVVVSGKAKFVQKTDKAIQRLRSPRFPTISVSQFPKTERENIKNRVKYQYAMLPDYVRKALEKKRVRITILPKLDAEREAKGVAGYTQYPYNRIYVKDDETMPLEVSMLHEIGHVLTYDDVMKQEKDWDISCLEEAKALGLAAYYQTKVEYAAEAFNLFVRAPELLRTQAPNTYAYLFHDLFGRGGAA